MYPAAFSAWMFENFLTGIREYSSRIALARPNCDSSPSATHDSRRLGFKSCLPQNHLLCRNPENVPVRQSTSRTAPLRGVPESILALRSAAVAWVVVPFICCHPRVAVSARSSRSSTNPRPALWSALSPPGPVVAPAVAVLTSYATKLPFHLSTRMSTPCPDRFWICQTFLNRPDSISESTATCSPSAPDEQGQSLQFVNDEFFRLRPSTSTHAVGEGA